MKILCVIDSLGSGGAQRQLVELALGFKERGQEVSFLVYHQLNFYKKTLDENDILVHEIIEPNYLKRWLKMRKFIRGGGYDVVLSFLEASNFICELAGLPRRKWKLVVGERSANPNISKSFKLRAYRWFHLLADYVVANSHENMRMVRKINPLISSKNCKVIYNSIDLEKWKHNTDYIPRKDGKFRLVVAASHQYLKNLNGLIEAVNLLSEKEKEQLVVEWYGDVQDTSKSDGLQKIKNYQLELMFKFYPATLSIKEKMRKADGIGLFSIYEGFPNAICEGMALSKPIICSKVSDTPVILANSSNLIFDPSSLMSIKQAISELLKLGNDVLLKIGKENRDIAKKYFDKATIQNQYINLISK